MAIDFPGSPSLGQRHSHSNTTWEWDGSSWNRITIDLYTTDAVTLSGIAATQFARRDDDNIITGVTTFIGNGYTGVGNTVLIVEGDARVTGVLSVGQGSVSINERDIYAVGVVTGANFKTGTTNVHNVGVEAAGINVLGADTPIGAGATVYNSGLYVGKAGAEYQGVVTASAFSGDGSGLVGVAATDFVHAQTLQVNGISTFAGVTTVTSETFFSKQGSFTGVVTASAFVGDGSGITGVANTDFVHAQTLQVNGISTFSDIAVRNITVTGIQTAEDVRNVDSIGIITARQGIEITSGTFKANSQVGTAGSVLSTTGSGIHWVSPQTGPQGAQGHQGVQGAAGAAGPQGAQGKQGTAGSSGGTGPQGVQGAQGHQGHQGVQGTQGVQGATNNLTIATSPPGSPAAGDLWWDSDDSDLHVYFNDGNSSQWVNINSGPAGAQGVQGVQGAQGYQGVQGSVGIASLTISTGAPSSPAQGDMWWESDTGNLAIYFNDGNSSQWVNINSGPSGAQGAQGAAGAAGAQGAQGHQGRQGATGAAGAQGAQGHQGRQGATGATTTINNNAVNRIITGSNTANTLNATGNFTYDGNELAVYAGTDDTDCILHLVGKTASGGVGQAGRTAIIAESTHNSNGQSSMHLRTRNTSNVQLIAMTIDGNQNVGIGTQLPQKKLEVYNGDIYLNSTDKKIFLTNDYDQYITANAASNYLVFGTANGERLRINSSGVVSIGGRDPAISAGVGLEISGNATTEIRLKNTSGGWANNNGFAIQKWNNGHTYLWEYDSGQSIRIGTSNAERMRFTPTGQVNIGGDYASTSNALQVTGNIKSTTRFNLNDAVYFWQQNRMSLGNSFIIESQQNTPFAILTQAVAQPIVFGTNSTERLRIDSSGRVGIKNTLNHTFNSNSNTLCIGDGGGAVGMTIWTAAGADGQFVSFQTNESLSRAEGEISYGPPNTNTAGDRNAMMFRTNSSERLRIDSSGHLHTGYTSSFGADHVNIVATDGGGISIGARATGNPSDGDLLGSLSFQGYMNGQALGSSEARISAIASANHSGSAAATDLVFYTKPTSTGPGSAPTERLRITSDGYLRFFNDTNTNKGLQWYNNVGGSAKAASIEWGNGNANWEFKHFRNDNQTDNPYANIDFFTGSTTSPTRALRITNDGNHIREKHSRFATRIAYNSGNEAANSKLPFMTPHVNVGSDFDDSNYRYVAPVDGDYCFFFHTNVNRSGAGNFYYLFYKNGGQASSSYGGRTYDQHSGTGWNNISGWIMLPLQEGDYVEIYNGGTAVNYDGNHYGQFMGWLVG